MHILASFSYNPNILTGYPDGDQELLSLFTKRTVYNNETDPKKVCVTVFTAVFGAIFEELRQNQFVTPLEWYERLGNIREISEGKSKALSVREVIYRNASNKWQDEFDQVSCIVR